MHQHILKVSELTKKVRFLLESELNNVWLTGEISNFINASSGHWYLSLKDSQSQVKCAMFKGSNRRVRMPNNAVPHNGMQVLVRAKVSLYEPRGDFQLIIEHLEPAGEGLLRQQYEQLKQQLHNEGLFDRHHKKPLPKHISHVGIVTSPTGAAVKDILTVLKRRNPFINAIIYPALVQGELAANDIVSAINQANRHQQCQVLIVGRGGGSLEDLWSFNEAAVVRAIYASDIPVVSAVGHEIDTTLADFVADLRAPTPSAAAELVSTDSSEQQNQIISLTRRLQQLQSTILRQQLTRLSALNHRLKQVHPLQQLQVQQQKADDLSYRLTSAITRNLAQRKQAPQQLSRRLQQLNPQDKIHYNQQQLSQIQRRLTDAIARIKQKKIDQFTHLIEQLQLVSPLATIARGYSISRNGKNQVLSSVGQTKVGEQITVQLSDGELSASVESIKQSEAS